MDKVKELIKRLLDWVDSERLSEIDGLAERIEHVAFRLNELEGDSDLTAKAAKLIRHQLGSIDLSDVEIEEMSENERAQYIGVAVGAFGNTIKQEAKKLLKAQEEYLSRTVDNEKTLMFSRGTVNGIMLILETYEDYRKEYIAREKKPDDFDPRNLFPEIEKST
jgi:hypothetical protein